MGFFDNLLKIGEAYDGVGSDKEKSFLSSILKNYDHPDYEKATHYNNLSNQEKEETLFGYRDKLIFEKRDDD